MKNNKGFTLIEIMIVVAIIAILAAVAIPSFARYRKDSQKTTCISNMRQIQTAAENYITGKGTVPATADLFGDADAYIKGEELKCPKDKTSTYTIEQDTTTGAIKVSCGSGDTEHVLAD